mmetsp:Transcript_29695/g.74221  ORF Transcript_29695/g.74221 Transcript_29695/m.74221 type:complete len:162 (-) Transcript_29695:245-730(-)
MMTRWSSCRVRHRRHDTPRRERERGRGQEFARRRSGSVPRCLWPPLPPPPPAKRASATSPSLQMRLQHARPGTATARVSVPGAHPIGGGEGGKSRGCAGGVEGWATVGYGPTETQVTRWKKDREAAEDDKEESMRRVVVKSRLFIEQIFNTKRPWRNDAIV